MGDGNDERAARVAPRRKLFQPAELDCAGGPQRIHLLDLSQTGALIHAAKPPIAGSFVGLLCGGERRSAFVAWVKGMRMGVTFVMPLTPAQVETMLTPSGD